MAGKAGIRTDCIGHTFESVDEAVAIAKKTGNKRRLENALEYRRRGKNVIHYCKGTDPDYEGCEEITTCENCESYRSID